ncbi:MULTISPECIES: regulatory protein RecX [unclassified Brevibacterium]|uniref:regulatory protein RecX n=1 Tax=unclassified Brevibacterium TaxID=2614124 RepID=UPI001BAE460F|nr:regulatory protein RecX [Brevibacterium sp. W7.2]
MTEERTSDARRPGEPGPEPAQLSALRAAMSDLEHRHAQGESGFFAGLAAAGDEVAPTRDDVASARDAIAEAGEQPARADALSLAPDVGDSPEFAESYAKAKKTALNMLAMRDHSSTELREKLAKRDFDPAAIDRLITKLERSNLLNDTEFARRFAKAQREGKKLSRSALRRQLSRKGIDEDTIVGVVDEVDGGAEGEESLARDVAEKKARSTRGLDHEVRERRILGMLARRGFSSTICLKVTREVLAEG